MNTNSTIQRNTVGDKHSHMFVLSLPFNLKNFHRIANTGTRKIHTPENDIEGYRPSLFRYQVHLFREACKEQSLFLYLLVVLLQKYEMLMPLLRSKKVLETSLTFQFYCRQPFYHYSQQAIPAFSRLLPISLTINTVLSEK